MATFYDEMAVMALEMITEFGQAVTISKTDPGEYDPELGGEAPGATVEQIAQGILLDFTGQEFQNNSLIRQGDKKLKIAAEGLAWVRVDYLDADHVPQQLDDSCHQHRPDWSPNPLRGHGVIHGQVQIDPEADLQGAGDDPAGWVQRRKG